MEMEEEKNSVKLTTDTGMVLRAQAAVIATNSPIDPKVAIHTKQAPYRTYVMLSATCTHVGCIVHWNSFEQCWDCPCHGSHFAANRSVLNAPAVMPLKRASR